MGEEVAEYNGAYKVSLTSINENCGYTSHALNKGYSIRCISDDSMLAELGDINNDSYFNIVDIIILIDIILDNYYGGQQPSDAVLWASDLNADGDIDILDVMLLLNIVLDVL